MCDGRTYGIGACVMDGRMELGRVCDGRTYGIGSVCDGRTYGIGSV